MNAILPLVTKSSRAHHCTRCWLQKKLSVNTFRAVITINLPWPGAPHEIWQRRVKWVSEDFAKGQNGNHMRPKLNSLDAVICTMVSGCNSVLNTLDKNLLPSTRKLKINFLHPPCLFVWKNVPKSHLSNACGYFLHAGDILKRHQWGSLLNYNACFCTDGLLWGKMVTHTTLILAAVNAQCGSRTTRWHLSEKSECKLKFAYLAFHTSTSMIVASGFVIGSIWTII